MADFPVCVTCKQTFGYKGPKPNLLPCLHPVCDNCVTSTTQDPKCSNCLTEFLKAGISIARDVVREREIFHLTAKHRPSELLCTNKDDENQAVSWCPDCREMFCEHCQISHDEVKVTRKHSMKRLEEMVSIDTWGDDPLICAKHPDQSMELYDKTCHKPICLKCLYQDHNAHDNVDIRDHMLSTKDIILDHLKSVKQHKKRVDELRSTSAQGDETLRTRYGLLRDSVCQTFEELRSLVDQRQKEVLLELDQCTNVVEEQRKSAANILQKKNTENQAKEEYLEAALLYLTPTNLILNGDKLTKVTSGTDEDLPRTDIRNTLIVFNKGNVDDIKTALTSFGSFLSLRDSKDHKKIAAIMTEMTGLSSQKTTIPQVHIETIKETSATALWSSITSESTAVKVDKQKVNQARVTDQNELMNRSPPYLRTSMSLKSYKGTVSTNSLPSTGFTYWEVHADNNVTERISGTGLVLEAGIAKLDAVNDEFFLRDSDQTNVMTVQVCKDHGRICIKIWKDGKFVTCAKNRKTNTNDSKFAVQIGILFDRNKNEISYFDLETETIIHTLSIVDVTEQLWATFGVYNEHLCHVRLKVVSGKDLQYTQAKFDWIKMAVN